MTIRWLFQLITVVFLELYVVFLLIRDRSRQFPLVLYYCGFELVSTAIGNIFYFGLHWSKPYLYLFCTSELVGHAFVTLIVLSLIRQSITGRQHQQQVYFGMLAAMACLALGSVLVFRDPLPSRWLVPVTRNLSFGEEICNLVLWSLLLQRSEFDQQYLIVSAGIGIQVTGEVIGHTLRLYTSPALIWVPNLLIFLCETLCLLIWVWAFRNKRPGASIGPPAVTRSGHTYS